MADNHKLDNTKLEEALEEFTKDRQKEKYAAVMELIEKAVVLVPSMQPQNLDEETQKRMKEGRQVQLHQDAQILPCML